MLQAASIFSDYYSELCIEGQQEPDMDYKQQYYECIEESWEPMTCPDGLVFDPINGNCFVSISASLFYYSGINLEDIFHLTSY